MLSALSQFIFGGAHLFGAHSSPRNSTNSNHNATQINHQQPGVGGSTAATLASLAWRDRSICFDLRNSDLELRHGEQLIACFYPIEDIKGNPMEFGLLMVTNLRLIWICTTKRRINLSIGLHTITITFQQNLKNAIGEPKPSLCVLCKHDSTKYEFVFSIMSLGGAGGISGNNNGAGDYSNGTCDRFSDFGWDSMIHQLKQNMASHKLPEQNYLSPMHILSPFEAVYQAWQCYRRTSLFRQCRANLTHLMPTNEQQQLELGTPIGELVKLPGEELIETYHYVARIESKALVHSGLLVLTNVRLVWIDSKLPLRNLSIPFIRILSIKLKHSNRVIFIHTRDYVATTNQVKFAFDPPTKSNDSQPANNRNTRALFDQITHLCSLYTSRPKFGPENCNECLQFMSQLRRLDLDEFGTTSLPENFGPLPSRDGSAGGRVFLVDPLTNRPVRDSRANGQWQIAPNNTNKDSDYDGDESIERNETDLASYGAKLARYLDEPQSAKDGHRNVIYSEELGLAVEKPLNGIELSRLWQIDVGMWPPWQPPQD